MPRLWPAPYSVLLCFDYNSSLGEKFRMMDGVTATPSLEIHSHHKSDLRSLVVMENLVTVAGAVLACIQYIM